MLSELQGAAEQSPVNLGRHHFKLALAIQQGSDQEPLRISSPVVCTGGKKDKADQDELTYAGREGGGHPRVSLFSTERRRVALPYLGFLLPNMFRNS